MRIIFDKNNQNDMLKLFWIPIYCYAQSYNTNLNGRVWCIEQAVPILAYAPRRYLSERLPVCRVPFQSLPQLLCHVRLLCLGLWHQLYRTGNHILPNVVARLLYTISTTVYNYRFISKLFFNRSTKNSRWEVIFLYKYDIWNHCVCK